MVFDVWDSESANIVGAFESQREALDALGHALDEHGSGYVSVLVLGVEDDNGESELIATGNELVRLVEEHLGESFPPLSPTGPPAAAPVANGSDQTRS